MPHICQIGKSHPPARIAGRDGGHGMGSDERELNWIEVLGRVETGAMTATKAARVLALSRRQVPRLLMRLHEDGPVGSRHGLRGRPSNRRMRLGTGSWRLLSSAKTAPISARRLRPRNWPRFRGSMSRARPCASGWPRTGLASAQGTPEGPPAAAAPGILWRTCSGRRLGSSLIRGMSHRAPSVRAQWRMGCAARCSPSSTTRPPR